MLVDAGRALRRFREARDLTQREVAERVGVNAQAVSQWERGDVVPRRAKVVHLDELLDARGALLAAFDYMGPDDVERLTAYLLDVQVALRVLIRRVEYLEEIVLPPDDRPGDDRPGGGGVAGGCGALPLASAQPAR